MIEREKPGVFFADRQIVKSESASTFYLPLSSCGGLSDLPAVEVIRLERVRAQCHLIADTASLSLLGPAYFDSAYSF